MSYLVMFQTYAWLRCLVVLLVVMIVSKVLKYSLKKKQKSLNAIYLGNVVQGILVFSTCLYILYQFPSTKSLISIILASSGLIVAVLGFAAQESLSNIINGLFITIFKPFEIGNRVKIQSTNLTGVIKNITLRHTVIHTFNNSTIIIPNSVMNKEIIENFHYEDSRFCMFLDITLKYNSDIAKAIAIMEETISKHPLYLDVRTEEEKRQGIPKVKVYARDLLTNGVTLRGMVWTADVNSNFQVCSDLRLDLLMAFKNEPEIHFTYNPYIMTN